MPREQQPITGSSDRKQETTQEVKTLLINGKHNRLSTVWGATIIRAKAQMWIYDSDLGRALNMTACVWDDVSVLTRF